MDSHGIFSTPRGRGQLFSMCSQRPTAEQDAQHVRKCVSDVAQHAIIGSPAASAKRVIALEDATKAAAAYLRHHAYKDTKALDLILDSANARLADPRAMGAVYGVIRTSADLAFLSGRQAKAARRRWSATLERLAETILRRNEGAWPVFQACLAPDHPRDLSPGKFGPQAMRQHHIGNLMGRRGYENAAPAKADDVAMDNAIAYLNALDLYTAPGRHGLFCASRLRQASTRRWLSKKLHVRPNHVSEVLATPTLVAKSKRSSDEWDRLATMRMAIPILTDASWKTLVGNAARSMRDCQPWGKLMLMGTLYAGAADRWGSCAHATSQITGPAALQAALVKADASAEYGDIVKTFDTILVAAIATGAEPILIWRRYFAAINSRPNRQTAFMALILRLIGTSQTAARS